MTDFLNSMVIERVLGVDVGIVGALVLLDGQGEIIEVKDMPVLRAGTSGRATVDPRLLASTIRRWRPTRVFVEAVNVRPGEGATGAFSYRKSFGVCIGVIAACEVSYSTVSPVAWRRTVGLQAGMGKDASRGMAVRRWPSQADRFRRVRDDLAGRSLSCRLSLLMRGTRLQGGAA